MHERIRTPRLLLRQWRDEDLEPFAALNADPEVMRHFPAPLRREESDSLATRLRTEIEERGWGLWALEVVDGPRTGFAGFTGITPIRYETHFTPAVEAGWRLAQWAWGSGYASEAARAALRVGFEEVGLDEIVALTAVGNLRSRSVMERLGMRRDPSDDFEHPSLPEGHPLRPHVLYRLRREAWASVIEEGPQAPSRPSGD
ncbi:GNAT family N-acetyltransferase [Naasia sp. SYSU D00057]|uniref:GNAT family N-acetyltransferase n=1 Tax=Naasia sp. SYSU D00057 TaxID=2817380 RepID=UPI001B301E1C|nr:GNAT family N-acetyltransferase [Naasia sp. SYSU D00057]